MVSLSILFCYTIAFAALALPVSSRDPLSYAPKPAQAYVAPKGANVTTLLDFLESRDDLTALAEVLQEPAGMLQVPILTRRR